MPNDNNNAQQRLDSAVALRDFIWLNVWNQGAVGNWLDKLLKSKEEYRYKRGKIKSEIEETLISTKHTLKSFNAKLAQDFKDVINIDNNEQFGEEFAKLFMLVDLLTNVEDQIFSARNLLRFVAAFSSVEDAELFIKEVYNKSNPNDDEVMERILGMKIKVGADLSKDIEITNKDLGFEITDDLSQQISKKMKVILKVITSNHIAELSNGELRKKFERFINFAPEIATFLSALERSALKIAQDKKGRPYGLGWNEIIENLAMPEAFKTKVKNSKFLDLLTAYGFQGEGLGFLDNSFIDQKVLEKNNGLSEKIIQSKSSLELLDILQEIGYALVAKSTGLTADNVQKIAEMGASNAAIREFATFKEKELDNLPDDVVSDGDYFICKLSKNDPRGAFIGLVTGCCQHLENAGRTTARYGYTDDDSCFYVTFRGKPPERDENGKIDTSKLKTKDIIAQCWAWQGNNARSDGVIVFDSIEMASTKDENRLAKVKKLYYELAKSLVENPKEIARVKKISRVMVGSDSGLGGGVPGIFKSIETPPNPWIGNRSVHRKYKLDEFIYSDAAEESQNLLFSNKNQFYKSYCESVANGFKNDFKVEEINACSVNELRRMLSACRGKSHELSPLLLGGIIKSSEAKAIEILQHKSVNKKLLMALVLASENNNKKLQEILLRMIEKDHGCLKNIGNGEFADLVPRLNLLLKNGSLNVKDIKGLSACANNRGVTLLMQEIILNEDKVIPMLLQQGGINLNACDKHGFTALYYALYKAQGANNYFLKQLIKNNVEINFKNPHGETALIMLCATPNHENIDSSVTMALRSGANVNIRDNDGRTALMHAVANGYIVSVHKLLSAGSDVNIEDKQHKTALTYAVANGSMESVITLLSNGAKISMKILNDAHRSGNDEIVNLLERTLNERNDVKAVNKKQQRHRG